MSHCLHCRHFVYTWCRLFSMEIFLSSHFASGANFELAVHMPTNLRVKILFNIKKDNGINLNFIHLAGSIFLFNEKTMRS